MSAPRNHAAHVEPSASPETKTPHFRRWIAVTVLVVAIGLVAGIIPRLHARHQLANEMRDLSVTTVNVMSPTREKPTSLLTLPARGTVASLFAPRETSAVIARSGTSGAPSLRPDSEAGGRR